MSGSANHGVYGNPGAQNSPWGPGSGWGNPGWDPWRAWYAAKPLWIVAMILGFIFWWPVGLALLFFGIWSKRMGYSGCGRYGAWQGGWQRGNWQGGPPPPWAGWKSFWCGGDRQQQRGPPAATVLSTNTAPRHCAGWRRSRRSSARSSTGCASPRTRPSLTSSWPSVATSRPRPSSRNRRPARAEFQPTSSVGRGRCCGRLAFSSP